MLSSQEKLGAVVVNKLLQYQLVDRCYPLRKNMVLSTLIKCYSTI